MIRHPRLVALIAGTVLVGLLPGIAFALPFAGNDSYSILEDAGATSFDVRANDNDIDGDTLTITAVTVPGHGTATTDGQTITYTPAANFNGVDGFGYTVDDGTFSTASATVTVTVTAQNDDPIANGDNATVAQNAAATAINVLGNDTDVDGDALFVIGVGTVSKGAVEITGGGTGLTYQPTTGATGSDSFTYTISDTHGGTASATVSVTITANDVAPVAGADSVTVLEDAAATAVAVLSNDSDPDSDPLTITDASAASKGVVAITGSGTGLTYKPNPNLNGPDSFTYTISDGRGGTAVGTVTVSITATEDPPVASADSATILEDAAATSIGVLSNDVDIDGDTKTITATSAATKGVVAITGGGTGLTYRPNANANGSDSFTYTISDGNGGTSTATVSVTITPANDVPNAVNDVGFVVPENAGATALAVKANDTDIDGDTLTITGVSNGAHGTVAITGSGTGLTYDPVQLFAGTDVFTYSVSDGHGGSDTATVLVTVGLDTTAPTVTAPVESFYGQTVGSSTMRAHLAWSAFDLGTGIAKYQLQVSVNGGAYATVTLASATSTSTNRTLGWFSSYRYRVRATDSQGNVSAFVYGPTFRPAVFQNSSSVVSYAGSWTTSKTSRALGSSHRYTTSLSARAWLTRACRDIAFVATKSPGSGSAQVWIDGVLSATINLRSSPATYRQLVYQRHFSTLSSHRIEIRPIGGGRVYLDAILLYR